MRFESNNSMQKHVTPPQRRWNVGVGLRSLSLSLVVVAATVLTPNANLAPAEAQAPPAPAVASSLSLASAGLGPVALNAIMEPGTLERIARRIRDERWKLPDDPAAWPIEDGKPVVQTQQLNELWHTILPGETLKRLRQMYRLNNASLQRLNPGVNL